MIIKTWPPRITICVGAVVLREQKVLLIREARGAHKGVWGIPWGFVEGRNDDGTLDPPQMAALRETHEEAGVGAAMVGLLGIQNHASSQGDPRIYMIFLCRHLSGEPTPDHDETDRAAYISKAEIESWDEPVDDFVRWIVLRVLSGEYTVIGPQPGNPYAPFMGFF
ncbi:MAG: NUDIX domain-containing protein [Chloroflexi bacterium]|nr:NUDIX domain-containing protein [Chloroflexota bacterium]